MAKRNSLIDNNVVIEPRREKGEPFVGPNALMVATPSELAFMVHLSHAERAVLEPFNPFKLFIAKRDKDLPLALAGPVLGAPQGVIVMEKLISLGAKRIWVLGWCGSLQPYLLIGDLIIPTTSLSEEGTSHHYPVNKKTRQTSSLLNKRLEHALLKANLPFKKGPVWTTDAIYRETEKKVIAYGKRGLLAVEMEMSALINLAIYRSVELAGLLIVSDELFSLEWHNGVGAEVFKKRSREAGRLLLDLCMV
ncbi:MAG: nucleoside phosphorylase [Deltaproteobacteria bacterium]|nr:MAG: nucleoside phosphorylase [Deltaproteobacteria bacterium]